MDTRNKSNTVTQSHIDIDDLKLIILDIEVAYDEAKARIPCWEEFSFHFDTQGTGVNKKLVVRLKNRVSSEPHKETPPHVFRPETGKVEALEKNTNGDIHLEYSYMSKKGKICHFLFLDILDNKVGPNTFDFRIEHKSCRKPNSCHEIKPNCVEHKGHNVTSGGGRGR